MIILGSLPALHNTFLTAVSNQLSPMPYPMRMAKMTLQGITSPTHEITVTPPKISPGDLHGRSWYKRQTAAPLNPEAPRRTRTTPRSSLALGPKEGKGAAQSLTLNATITTKRAMTRPTVGKRGGGKEGQGPRQGETSDQEGADLHVLREKHLRYRHQ